MAEVPDVIEGLVVDPAEAAAAMARADPREPEYIMPHQPETFYGWKIA